MITNENPFEKQPEMKNFKNLIIGWLLLLILIIGWPVANKAQVLICSVISACNLMYFALSNTDLNN